jgi:hypothetical protein
MVIATFHWLVELDSGQLLLGFVISTMVFVIFTIVGLAIWAIK